VQQPQKLSQDSSSLVGVRSWAGHTSNVHLIRLLRLGVQLCGWRRRDRQVEGGALGLKPLLRTLGSLRQAFL